jgi:hypothetical protein
MSLPTTNNQPKQNYPEFLQLVATTPLYERCSPKGLNIMSLNP